MTVGVFNTTKEGTKPILLRLKQTMTLNTAYQVTPATQPSSDRLPLAHDFGIFPTPYIQRLIASSRLRAAR